MKFSSGSVHISNHGANITDNRGKDEDTDEEVDSDKEVFNVLSNVVRIALVTKNEELFDSETDLDGLWSLSNGCKCQCGPVEAVNVLRRELGNTLIHPSVTLKANIEAESEEEASVPVDQEKDVQYHLRNQSDDSE